MVVYDFINILEVYVLYILELMWKLLILDFYVAD